MRDNATILGGQMLNDTRAGRANIIRQLCSRLRVADLCHRDSELPKSDLVGTPALQ